MKITLLVIALLAVPAAQADMRDSIIHDMLGSDAPYEERSSENPGYDAMMNNFFNDDDDDQYGRPQGDYRECIQSNGKLYCSDN